AWVGTSKTRRRRRTGERGVASQTMNHVLDKARERGQVASALMPFRVSFYEHFGYGLCERLHSWTIPMSIIVDYPDSNWRFGTMADKAAMLDCRARQSRAGHCDVETDQRTMDEWFDKVPDTQLFVDDRDGRIVAYSWVRLLRENDRTLAQAVQPAWDSIE